MRDKLYSNAAIGDGEGGEEGGGGPCDKNRMRKNHVMLFCAHYNGGVRHDYSSSAGSS